MAVGRVERREDRREVFEERFGGDAEVALDILEIVELAWHDCYGEVTPPTEVERDIVLVSQGTIEGLVAACRLALQDRRDLRLAASDVTDP